MERRARSAPVPATLPVNRVAVVDQLTSFNQCNITARELLHCSYSAPALMQVISLVHALHEVHMHVRSSCSRPHPCHGCIPAGLDRSAGCFGGARLLPCMAICSTCMYKYPYISEQSPKSGHPKTCHVLSYACTVRVLVV